MPSTSPQAGGPAALDRVSVPASERWTVVPLTTVIDPDRIRVTLPTARRVSRTELRLVRDRVEVWIWTSGVVLFRGPTPVADAVLRTVEAAANARLEWRDAVVWEPGSRGLVAGTGVDSESVSTTFTRDGAPAAQRALAGQVMLRRCWRLVEQATAATAERTGARLSLPWRRGRQFAGTLGYVRLQCVAWGSLVSTPTTRTCVEVRAEGKADPGSDWRALEDQLQAVEGVWETVRSEWNHRRGHQLEWIIILLIGLDIALALWA